MSTIKKEDEARRARMQLIAAIAKRAESECKFPRIVAILDVDYADQDVGLDLDKLLAFDAFNFAHDIFGINKHMNHQTFKLDNCFLPRSTRPSKEEATE